MAQAKPQMPEPRALNPTPSGTRPIVRPGHEAVAYHIPISPSTSKLEILKTTISLPRRSAWTSGLHFHARHTEYLRLIKGAIFVELNGAIKFISALAGGEVDLGTGQKMRGGMIIDVPRYARHNWGRLEYYIDEKDQKTYGEWTRPEDWDEEVIVEEWTDPSDLSKPLFFWNLNGVITAPDDPGLPLTQRAIRRASKDWWTTLQLFIIFWELDNWPVFVSVKSQWFVSGFGNSVELVMSFVVLFVARVVGLVVGLQAVGRSRTPEGLWEAHTETLKKSA
ncbi:hypothetical protein N0V94_003298 [Neodidymelliopsis sp. IMI 364377]|nr:hypothetical protein N0V94_003298 [Neodidymelliopsis sp. IMI 364377]